MLKKMIALFMLVCVGFTFAACSSVEEYQSEFASQLQDAVEQEVNDAVDQAKSNVKKKVKTEAEKLKLKGQVTLFREELKRINVSKKNRVEMLYLMESILKLCEGERELTYEVMQIRALYGLSNLMVKSRDLYEDMDELDSTISDFSSIITGDYVQFFADKAVSNAMKTWEKETDKAMDDAIESTLNTIAKNDKIWEVITNKYLEENGY